MTALLPAAVLLTAYFFVTRSRQYRSVGVLIGSYLLLAYFSITLEIIGFPSLREWQASLTHYGSIFNPVVNFIPFSDGYQVFDTLNLVLFVPLGFLLPLLYKQFQPFGKTLLFGILFTIGIEVSQLFTLHRATDINDLIMNTLGVIVGWLMYRLFFGKKVSKQSELFNTEEPTPNRHSQSFDWVILLILPILITFLI